VSFTYSFQVIEAWSTVYREYFLPDYYGVKGAAGYTVDQTPEEHGE